MSEYIVKLPTDGAADEWFKTHECPDKTLYGYPLTGEITRCRDCEYSLAHGNGCGAWPDIHDVEPDGFCAWAVKRDE